MYLMEQSLWADLIELYSCAKDNVIYFVQSSDKDNYFYFL